MAREGRGDGTPQRTWWDRRDEPPELLVEALEAAKRGARVLVPPEKGPESSRGRWIRMIVLAAIFLGLVWLLFVGLVHQS